MSEWVSEFVVVVIVVVVVVVAVEYNYILFILLLGILVAYPPSFGSENAISQIVFVWRPKNHGPRSVVFCCWRVAPS